MKVVKMKRPGNTPVRKKEGASDPKKRQSYDWGKYTDGEVYEFIRGRDYYVVPRNFARAARLWSSRHGFDVQVKIQGENVFVKISRKKQRQILRRAK